MYLFLCMLVFIRVCSICEQVLKVQDINDSSGNVSASLTVFTFARCMAVDNLPLHISTTKCIFVCYQVVASPYSTNISVSSDQFKFPVHVFITCMCANYMVIC